MKTLINPDNIAYAKYEEKSDTTTIVFINTKEKVYLKGDWIPDINGCKRSKTNLVAFE